jgi:hypothetical protein
MKTWRKFGFVPPSENKASDGFHGASLGLPMANTSEADIEAKNSLKIDLGKAGTEN